MEGISADEKKEDKGEMEIDKPAHEISEVEMEDRAVEENQTSLDQIGKDTPMSESYELEDEKIQGNLEVTDEKASEASERLAASRIEEVAESDKNIDKMEIDAQVIVEENKESIEESEGESGKLTEPVLEIKKELTQGSDVKEELGMPVDENTDILPNEVEEECREYSKSEVDDETSGNNKVSLGEEAVKMHVDKDPENPTGKIDEESSDQVKDEINNAPLDAIPIDLTDNLNQELLAGESQVNENNKEKINLDSIEEHTMPLNDKDKKDDSDDRINEVINEPSNLAEADHPLKEASMSLDVIKPLDPDEELSEPSEDAIPDNFIDSVEEKPLIADIQKNELPTEPLTTDPIEEAKELPTLVNTPQTPILEEEATMDLDPKPLEDSSPSPQKPSDVLRDQFNYYFDANLTLKHTETNESFKFVTQKHYEQLGKCVQQYIQQQMSEQYGLLKVKIPESERSQSYIYISKNFTSPDNYHKKALLLIQGAGAVRPGIWARSVCINDSLSTGSMLPFLSFAQENQYEVIIFNPNKHYSKSKPIRSNDTLERHGKYVWENFIRKCNSDELYIVAHSCGGISTVSLMNLFWQEFKDRVKGVAFTDAVHGYYGMNREKVQFLRRYAVDWVASSNPRDEIEKGEKDGVVFVSSGHRKHEYTTGYAYPSIVKFLEVIAEYNPYLKENRGRNQARERKKIQ